MNIFELIYEFDGKKFWTEIKAKTLDEAKKILFKKTKDNNIVFISVNKVYRK
jgi:hypothetical protein